MRHTIARQPTINEGNGTLSDCTSLILVYILMRNAAVSVVYFIFCKAISLSVSLPLDLVLAYSM